MSERAVAQRYAEALFEVAHAHGELDRIEDDLNQPLVVIRTDARLWNTLINRRVSPVFKKQLLDSLLDQTRGDEASSYSRNFYKLLVDKQRIRHLEQIAEMYRQRANEARNLAEVEVRLAAAPTADLQTLLQHSLEEALDKRVLLHTRVDPELIGGVIVQVGDRRYDRSVRRSLVRLHRRLAENGAAGSDKGVSVT